MTFQELQDLVEQLLQPAPEGDPAGIDLENANETAMAYIQLFDMVKGKGEVEIGSTVIAAEEPDWKGVVEGCLDFCRKSRDLSVGALLTLGWLKTEGLPGVAAGLGYIRGLIERFWDTFYPKLDPDDDNDPTMRVNRLDALNKPPNTYGDTWRFQSRLLEAPLASSRQIGRFSQRHIMLATGEIAPGEGVDVPDAAAIEAAFDDTPLEELQETAECLRVASENLEAIDRDFSARVGSGAAADLSALKRMLGAMHKSVKVRIDRRTGAPDDGGDLAPGASEGGTTGGPRIAGEITRPDDVLLALDKIIRYYDTREPSSPLPMLLRRARRLVGKSFVDVVKDLSPDAINQLSVLSGVDLSQEDAS
ncbi:MAG: type VI secretion system protein TssA [Phycisphaeraceae bacterium]|nr:type VI secretion system protein TssA [Phycisphaeraceae bacterium]MCW5753853.1 type VI secretion system protein TssA [Phycisphaeraceae bacterium]